MSNKQLPPELVEEFKASSKNLCSWQAVADFAETQARAVASTPKLDRTKPRKMVEDIVKLVKDEESGRYTYGWFAISVGSSFMEKVRHPFPASNPDLVLEKSYKVGCLKNSILTELTLLQVVTPTTSGIGDQLSLNLFALKAEVPEATMENCADLFCDDKRRPLRPDILTEIQAIFDGPSGFH